MKRVVGYVRVSTVAQDVERQKKLIMDYVASNGYILVSKIEVDKVSGAKSDRRGLNKILNLTNEDADIVVISELSRLSREDDIMNVMQEIHRILNNGLDLVMLDDPNKIYKANQHLNLIEFITLAIKAYGAAEERKKISERMKTGKYSKLEDNPNMLYNSIIPFGYKSVPNPEYVGKPDTAKSLLVEDEEQSKIVKMMYQMVYNGKTVRETANELKEIGIKGNRNTPINFSTVYRILRSPLYNGIRIIKGKSYSIKKMIDDEVWNTVQTAIDSNNIYKGKRQEHFNPLKGIAKCPCGNNLSLLWYSGSHSQYRCADKSINRSLSNCTNIGISFNVMIKAVWYLIRATSITDDYKVQNNKQINSLKELNAGLLETIDSNKLAINKLSKEIDTIINNIASSDNATVISVLNGKVSSKESEIEFLKNSINNAEKKIRKNELKIKDINRSISRIEFENFTLEQKAEEFKKRLEKVTYYSENSRRGFIVVDFKNGSEYVVIYKFGKETELYALPDNFKFNSKSRKISVSTFKKSSETTFSVLSEPSNSEYDILTILENFDLSEYRL